MQHRYDFFANSTCLVCRWANRKAYRRSRDLMQLLSTQSASLPFYHFTFLSCIRQVLGLMLVLSFCQLANFLTWHFVYWSACRLVNFPFCWLGILSDCHFVTFPFCQLAILSAWHFVNFPFCQLAISSTWHFSSMTNCEFIFDLIFSVVTEFLPKIVVLFSPDQNHTCDRN